MLLLRHIESNEDRMKSEVSAKVFCLVKMLQIIYDYMLQSLLDGYIREMEDILNGTIIPTEIQRLCRAYLGEIDIEYSI